MPHFLVLASYTTEAIAAMVQNPQNRMESIAPVAEKLGGKLLHTWLSFGEYDSVSIFEFPANVNAVALSFAASASGAVQNVVTIPLISWEKGMEAMLLALGAEFEPPEEDPA